MGQGNLTDFNCSKGHISFFDIYRESDIKIPYNDFITRIRHLFFNQSRHKVL